MTNTTQYDLLITFLEGKDNGVHLFTGHPNDIFPICGFDAFTEVQKIGRIASLPSGNTTCDRCKEIARIPIIYPS